MGSLTNNLDVENTLKSFSANDKQSMFVRIPKERTPWMFWSAEYYKLYQHWVDGDNGRYSVACAGGNEGKGWAPDVCAICRYVKDVYAHSRALASSGRAQESDNVKKKGNTIRAKASVLFKVVRGQYVTEVVQETGKRRRVAYFTPGEGEENTCELGLLGLTKAQFEKLIGLRNAPDTAAFIKDGSDYLNHVFWTEKRQSGNSSFEVVHWGAEPQITELSSVSISKELQELNLESLGIVNSDDMKRAIEGLTGAPAPVAEPVSMDYSSPPPPPPPSRPDTRRPDSPPLSGATSMQQNLVEDQPPFIPDSIPGQADEFSDDYPYPVDEPPPGQGQAQGSSNGSGARRI